MARYLVCIIAIGKVRQEIFCETIKKINFYRFIIFGMQFNMELPITLHHWHVFEWNFCLPIYWIYFYIFTQKKIDYVCENN